MQFFHNHYELADYIPKWARDAVFIAPLAEEYLFILGILEIKTFENSIFSRSDNFSYAE